MTEQTVPCQFCKGAGRTGLVHVNRGAGGGEWLDNIPCFECGGSGSWSMNRWEAWQKGQKMKAARLARGESLREAAKMAGVSAARMSAIERGRAEQ